MCWRTRNATEKKWCPKMVDNREHLAARKLPAARYQEYQESPSSQSTKISRIARLARNNQTPLTYLSLQSPTIEDASPISDPRLNTHQSAKGNYQRGRERRIKIIKKSKRIYACECIIRHNTVILHTATL